MYNCVSLNKKNSDTKIWDNWTYVLPILEVLNEDIKLETRLILLKRKNYIFNEFNHFQRSFFFFPQLLSVVDKASSEDSGLEPYS